jgi:hypothetical protein
MSTSALNIFNINLNNNFDLLTNIIKRRKNKNKNKKFINLFRITRNNFYKNSSEKNLRNKRNFKIKSVDDLKEIFNKNQYLCNKLQLSSNNFIQNEKSRNKKIIYSQVQSSLLSLEDKYFSEGDESDDYSNSKSNLPRLNSTNHMINIIRFQKEYKKKNIDNKITNILRNELFNAQNKVKLNFPNKNSNFSLKKIKPKNSKLMRMSINYSDSNDIYTKKINENTFNKVREFNFFNKIKLLNTPPIFQINSKITKKAIIKDIKVMNKFERFNFQKLKL